MSTLICEVPSDVPAPPRFIVNLDLPPMQRWEHISRLYIDELRQAEQYIETVAKEILGGWITPIVESLISTIMAGVTKLGLVYYGQELKGLSQTSGIPLGKLVMIQFAYECAACCTSIVCKNEETNIPMHIRTMDWGLDILKPLTIDVDFQKNNQTIYKATTWIGYVGILTGMRVENGYSVSVNFRHTDGTLTTNLKTALSYGWPVGFLVRETLESTHSYDIAIEQLAQSSIIAPCYFTICGTSKNETMGTLLTRRQTSEERRWIASQHGTIIQTNIDHWSSEKSENILYSIERRNFADKLLKEMKSINEEELWQLISKSPIYNSITIYGTFMCPEYGIYHTRYPKGYRGFQSNQSQLLSTLDNKDNLSRPLSLTHICSKCNLEFNINDNPGGGCAHTGTWHSAFEDCSYVKCGFYLGKKGSIGRQHWSCCYSLDRGRNTCKNSAPHTFKKDH